MNTIIRVTNPACAVVRDELEARGITQKAAAAALGVSATYLGKVQKGSKPISTELALKLEAFLGIRAEYFLSLQSSWKLKEVKREKASEIAAITLYTSSADTKHNTRALAGQ